MDANGGQPVQVSDPPFGVGDWLPEWCSSNQWLLFERGDHVTATQNQRLFWTAYGAVAGQEHPWPYVPSRASLTGSPACPATGPDVYLGAVAQQTDWHLYRSAGAEATVFGLGFEKLAAVAVSIDGQRVAFAYRDVVDNSGKYYLHVASTSDPHDFALIQPSGVDSVLSMGWSPDGARLAYVCQVTGSRVWQLCLSNATGGGLSVPTLVIRDQAQARGNLTALAGSPTWSPDGQWVVFASNQDGDWDIYKYNVNDGRVVNLTAGSPANEFMPSWSR
jgi:Tol biopolymer transport system component